MKKRYPELRDVTNADRVQLCKWHRFLRSPETSEEATTMNLIESLYAEKGGMTPEISKEIGLGGFPS